MKQNKVEWRAEAHFVIAQSRASCCKYTYLLLLSDNIVTVLFNDAGDFSYYSSSTL